MKNIPIDTYKSVLEDLTYLLKFFTNVLHFLQFRITLQTRLFVNEVSNNSTNRESIKALAFVYMKYFYDLFSHLEYELQHIRNDCNENYVLNHNPWFDCKKKVVPNYYSYEIKKFKTNEFENANDYYGKKNNRFPNKLMDVKRAFNDSYEAIDHQFHDTKKSLVNYIGYIRQYFKIDYEIKYITAIKKYKLCGDKNRPYPNHKNFLIFNDIMINILQFTNIFSIGINYKSDEYYIPKIQDYSKQFGLGLVKDSTIDYGYYTIDLINIWDKVEEAIKVVKEYNINFLMRDMGALCKVIDIFFSCDIFSCDMKAFTLFLSCMKTKRNNVII
jgi:hypothetical protein